MTQEENQLTPKQVKTVFVGDEHLPTHYVNSVNIRAGLDEFFLTLGTVLPLDITNVNELEHIDSISAQALFRCAISRPVMKQVIDLMTALYENQTNQIELLQASQGKDQEHVNRNNRSSEL